MDLPVSPVLCFFSVDWVVVVSEVVEAVDDMSRVRFLLDISSTSLLPVKICRYMDVQQSRGGEVVWLEGKFGVFVQKEYILLYIICSSIMNEKREEEGGVIKFVWRWMHEEE